MKSRPTKRQKELAVENFIAFLKKRRCKITQERIALVELMFDRHANDHFSADVLSLDAHTNNIPISRATIYRTLELLEEASLVRGMLLDDKTKHYDLSFEEESHDHFICRICGKMIEAPNPEVLAQIKTMARKYGFEVESHTLTVTGVCAACRK